MSFITDAGPGTAAVRDGRIADDDPAVSDVQRQRSRMPQLPSDAVLPDAVKAAVEAMGEAEDEAYRAVDELARTRARVRQAQLDDATALRDRARAGKDLSDAVHDAHERIALGEHARAVAIARAYIGVVVERVAAVNRAAREHASQIERTARDRLAEIAPQYAKTINDALAARSGYIGAVADVASAIAFRVEVEHRAAGPTHPDLIRMAVAAVPKPNTATMMRVGTRRIEIGDALAAIQQDAQRHVEREPREPTADDHALKAWAEDRTSKDPGGKIRWS